MLRRSDAVHKAFVLMSTRSADDGERTSMACFASLLHDVEFHTGISNNCPLMTHGVCLDSLTVERTFLLKQLNVHPHKHTRADTQPKQVKSRWRAF